MPTMTPVMSPSLSLSVYPIEIVCILWFGGHKVVGLHVTVPSLHGVEPLPVDLCGAAPAGERAPTVKTAMPRTRATVRIMTLPSSGGPFVGWPARCGEYSPHGGKINPNPARDSINQ